MRPGPGGGPYSVAMSKGRLEAFSDGVFAVIITIMVLELKAPHGADWQAFRPLLPMFLTYALSYVFLGIYWNNHHHMMHASDRINGAVLWANLHLLFWLSLVPFVTGWMGENHFAPLPTAVYGGVLFMAGVAFVILEGRLLDAGNPRLAEAVGKDVKGKISAVLYLSAIPLAFVNELIADGIYVFVAMMWLVPDRRIEKKLSAPS
ncbi:MAG: Integral rane protein [Acidobacteria bacterium]|nr:Integral rane protein [Acidobacteriota bacterium]